MQHYYHKMSPDMNMSYPEAFIHYCPHKLEPGFNVSYHEALIIYFHQ